jgi:dTDP-4-dehydrorhamnose reductase
LAIVLWVEEMGPVLITGGAGLLGGALLATRPEDLGDGLCATWHERPTEWNKSEQVDLASRTGVEELFRSVQPSLVIHTAYSKIDGRRNIVEATTNVAWAAKETGAELLHISTDLVFGGGLSPYAEGDQPSPVNEYGIFKAEAEARVSQALPAATIIRTSLITSVSPLDPNSSWIAEALRAGKSVQLFVDELRCPIGAEDLAKAIWEIATLPPGDRQGVWHVVGLEAMSRYALGLLIADHEDLDRRLIEPRLASAHPEPRPRDVRLTCSRTTSLRQQPTTVSALFGMSRRRDR